MGIKGKVLIVDDDPLNLGFMSGYLADIGYEVVTAGSGEEALAVVAVIMPDIILMDIMMPGLNGYQVTRKLKNKRETSNIPIVLVTALGANQAKVKGLEAGADDFLVRSSNVLLFSWNEKQELVSLCR